MREVASSSDVVAPVTPCGSKSTTPVSAFRSTRCLESSICLTVWATDPATAMELVSTSRDKPHRSSGIAWRSRLRPREGRDFALSQRGPNRAKADGVRAEGNPMRFVIVSDRTPRIHSVCAHCAKPIDVGYLREFVSNLPYCDCECYRGHGMALSPWSFTGFNSFVLVGLQLAEYFQRVLLDAYRN